LDSQVSQIVRQTQYASICLSLKEVAAHVSHKVLMEFDDNGSLIFGDPQGILDLQFIILT
jgi:hypothetical protein